MTEATSKTTPSPAISPLLLKSVRIISLNMCEINKDDAPPDCSLKIQHSVEPKTMACTVLIDLNLVHYHESSNVNTYSVSVKLEGYFEFLPGVPEEIRKRLIPVSPATNLLGFLRGMIFHATSILPCGSISVPLLDLTKVFPPKKEVSVSQEQLKFPKNDKRPSTKSIKPTRKKK